MSAAMTMDEQIDFIIRLMLAGDWHGMKSRAELAKQWGMSERAVGDRSDKASVVLSRQGKGIEVEAREALAELDAIKKMALSYVTVTFGKDGEEHVVEQPKLREATDAIKLKVEILGITSKSRGRNERDKPSVEDKWESMSREEKIARLKEALDEELRGAKEELQ